MIDMTNLLSQRKIVADVFVSEAAIQAETYTVTVQVDASGHAYAFKHDGVYSAQDPVKESGVLAPFKFASPGDAVNELVQGGCKWIVVLSHQ